MTSSVLFGDFKADVTAFAKSKRTADSAVAKSDTATRKVAMEFVASGGGSAMLYEPKGDADKEKILSLFGEEIPWGDFYTATKKAVFSGCYTEAEKKLLALPIESVKDNEKESRKRLQQRLGAYMGNLRSNVKSAEARVKRETEALQAIPITATEEEKKEAARRAASRSKAFNVSLRDKIAEQITRLEKVEGEKLSTMPNGSVPKILRLLKEAKSLCE